MNTQIKMNEANLTAKAEEKRKKKSKSHDKQKTHTTSLGKVQYITNHDVVKYTHFETVTAWRD